MFSGLALKQFHTIRVDCESNANRIRFEIETPSHDDERQYESNTIRNSHRRTKQFVCLPVFIRSKQCFLNVLAMFSGVALKQFHTMRIEYDSKPKQLRRITKGSTNRTRFEIHIDALSNSYVYQTLSQRMKQCFLNVLVMFSAPFSECFESQNGAISTNGLPMMRKWHLYCACASLAGLRCLSQTNATACQ